MFGNLSACEHSPSVQPTPEILFRDVGAGELESAAGSPLTWLWEGYLAPGNVTLLTSQWKSGKTTLVSVLLARLKEGGTLAGQALRAGRALVVSEEPAQLWLTRRMRRGFCDTRFLCRPFRGRPSWPQWQALIDHLGALHARQRRDLVVIDSLAHFFPGRSENDAAAMTAALAPLARLAEAGLSVLVLHHPRRKESAPGQSARGSGALQGSVDVILEMRVLDGAGPDDRRRRLEALSRYDATPRDRVIELSADGGDYACLGDFEDATYEGDWQVLHGLLSGAERPLAVREIVKEWPPRQETPAEATLWRRLTRALGEGRLSREGAGRRSDPYRYFLPEMAEKWERQRREESEQAAQELPAVDPERAAREEMTEALRRAHLADLKRLQGASREGR